MTLISPWQRSSGRIVAALDLVKEYVSAAFRGVGTTLVLWAQRIRERDELRNLDSAARRELFLSPCDISREADKWFWQE